MSIIVSTELLQKYDRPGPRYTSYPTAPVWSGDFGAKDHQESLRRADVPGEPLSLYVHLPFCKSMCWYCGCNVFITQDTDKIVSYVDRVLAEAALARSFMSQPRPVIQHHWGGGTPTHLPAEEMVRLFSGLQELFPASENAEISIEIDPRVTTVAQLETLRTCGFNRISMGVQDFDSKVQKAIHRIQSYEETRELTEAAKSLGFVSLNVDLVYGLPHQTLEGFGNTIERILELEPDRVACYCYAHVPWIKKHQKIIQVADLPQGKDKMTLYLLALNGLQNAGFAAIGMDHFARPGDSLHDALNTGRLHRNFMGYTTQPANDMISFGVTSISEMAGAFAQNLKDLNSWHAAIEAGRLPVDRGMRRSPDDDRRRRIILDLMCKFRLKFDQHGGADAFTETYREALRALQGMGDDGLVTVSADGIEVSELGRLFLRNVCMPFDAYLEKQLGRKQPMFSKTV